MGWGRWFFLGDLSQQLDLDDHGKAIQQLRSTLHAQRTESVQAVDELRQLRAENNELKLYLAATLRLLMGKGVITRDEIQELVRAIDAEDGVIDNATPRSLLGDEQEPGIDPGAEGK